jgi:tape measure domain-containing protein
MSFTYNLNLGVFGTAALDSVIGKLDRMEQELGQVKNGIFATSSAMKSGFTSVGSSVTNLDTKLNKARSSIIMMGSDARRTEGQMKSSFAGMGAGVGGMLAQVGLVAGAYKSLTTSATIDAARKSIAFASGDEGAANLAFIDKEVDRLNIDMMGAYEGFKTLQGSLMGTGMEGVSKQLFSGMAEASAALGMPREAFELSLKAFGQMASKGVVMSEELKLQLGDHLPGALNIAAKSMGMSTGELMKMMEKGELLATEFLPAISDALHQTFAVQAAENSKSATAQLNKFNNSMYRAYDIMGKQLLPVFTSFVDDFLIPGITWLSENKEGVMAVASALVIATAAQWLMNAAMAANPIGAVVIALGILATAFFDTYKSSATFRAEVSGLWEVFKNVGGSLIMYILTPLEIAAKLLQGLLQKDLGIIGEALMIAPKRGWDLAKNLYNAPSDYNQAYDSSIAGHKSAMAGNYMNFAKTTAVDKNQAFGPYVHSFLGGNGKGASAAPGASIPELSKGINGINEGGRHSKVINISVGKFQDEINIYAATAEQGMDDMVDMLTRKLTQIINNANQVQTTF